MLIIGREVGQSVIIDDHVKVTILHDGLQLRLVIDAPKGVTITRKKPNAKFMRNYKKRVKVIGEILHIGDSIKMSLLQTESGLIRFAIDAPKEVNICREELTWNRSQSEKQIVHNCC